jgi:hypothetical protein
LLKISQIYDWREQYKQNCDKGFNNKRNKALRKQRKWVGIHHSARTGRQHVQKQGSDQIKLWWYFE